jgi:hypothetical protein
MTANRRFPAHKDDPIGRRYRHPSVTTIAMLLVVLSCIGLLLSLVGPLPQQGGQYGVLTSSLCIVLTPLWKYIGQTNHELDPRSYSKADLTWSSQIMVQTLGNVIPSTMMILMAALVTEVVVGFLGNVATQDNDNPSSSSSFSGLTVASTVALSVTTLLCLWTQNLWEECLRLLLFTKRHDLINIISEFVDNSHLECARIMLECVLSDCTLVDDIMATHSITLNEDARVKALGQRYGQQLVHKLPQYVEAPLEEDMIRFNILEAFGSSKVNGQQNTLVQSWLKTDPKFMHGGFAQEIPCVPLIRGLCVVVGGMGTALHSISDSTKRTPASTRGHWELSVGGIIGLSYSVSALEYFLWPDVAIPPRTIQQMKTFFPVALSCLYELHTGLQLYRNMHDARPDTREVMQQCEDTVARMASRFTMSGVATVTLDHRVVEWVGQCKNSLPGAAATAAAGGGGNDDNDDAVLALR